MKSGPDIAMVAALVGDPARSNMLTALMSGRALTASELAQEAALFGQDELVFFREIEIRDCLRIGPQPRPIDRKSVV